MKIGYARVSTKDQNLDLQIIALKKAGCDKIYMEKISAGKERKAFNRMMKKLKPNDTLVIWKLDRLGRSLSQLVSILEYFRKHNIGLHSIRDNIDMNTSIGKFQYAIIAAMAELERDITKERTYAGLEAAKARGVRLGRRKGLSESAKQKAIKCKKMYLSNIPIKTIQIELNICKSTLYSYLKYQNVELRRG